MKANRLNSARILVVFAASLGLASTTLGQGYPKVPHDIQAAADERKAAADRRSDEIFAREQPEIQAPINTRAALGESAARHLGQRGAAWVRCGLMLDRLSSTRVDGTIAAKPKPAPPRSTSDERQPVVIAASCRARANAEMRLASGDFSKCARWFCRARAVATTAKL